VHFQDAFFIVSRIDAAKADDAKADDAKADDAKADDAKADDAKRLVHFQARKGGCTKGKGYFDKNKRLPSSLQAFKPPGFMDSCLHASRLHGSRHTACIPEPPQAGLGRKAPMTGKKP
jgi:hypothetical protein